MPQRILGVDLGSWSVKAVLVETGFRGLDVVLLREVRVAEGPPETRHERQRAALEALMGDGTLKADVYVAGFPGEAATLRFLPLPFADAKRIEQTIGGELSDAVPFELTDAVFDHALLRKKDDGASLVLAAVAQKEALAEHLSLCQGAGFDPRFVPVDVLALYNLYAQILKDDQSRAETPGAPVPEAGTFIAPVPGGPPDARMVLDIGHERSQVCVAGPDGIAYARTIRAGGKEVTLAIAKAYALSFEDAEEGKHADGQVASSRHPAPTDVSQRMSEVVAEGLQPLVRELRRTLQAIRGEKRVRVARIDLVGGGARLRDLAPYLAEQLNVPVASGLAVEQLVDRHLEPPRRAAYAGAIACALRPTAENAAARIDLRVGDYQFAGQLQQLRARVPAIAAAAGVLFLLMAVNVWAQYFVAKRREAALNQQFCDVTQKVLGKAVCEPAVALSMMRQPASELGAFSLPERSAFRVAADISALIPMSPELVVTELEVNNERARINGEAASFDAVDQIVAELGKDQCMTEIKKAKLRKNSDGKGVEFQLSVKLRCS